MTDFHSLHGGYATLIMPHVHVDQTLPLPAENAPPIVMVRRSQVRGGQSAIGFGTAGYKRGPIDYASRRIAFEDNVILNTDIGLNTDTGAVGWLELRRNAFLDVLSGPHLGRWNESWCCGTVAGHHRYTIERNLFRLRGRDNVRDYHDYNQPTAGGAPLTDPNLALGRLYNARPASAMEIRGRATKLVFQDNWVTTWPAGSFFKPSPGGPVPEEKFWVVWTPEPQFWFDVQHGKLARYPAGEVTLQNSRLSHEPFVFAPTTQELGNGVSGAELVAAPRLAATAALVGTTCGSCYQGTHYSSAYQGDKTPASSQAGTFMPRGRVERAIPYPHYNPRDPGLAAPGDLTHLREVVLGDCTVTPGGPSHFTVNVSARLLDHYLPGTSTPGTVPAVGADVYFYAEMWVDGQVVEPVSGGGTFGPDETDATGVATLALNLYPPGGTLPANIHFRIFAWFIHDPSDGSSGLNRHDDAWSSLDLPYGQVVTLDALPDVGDDKNTAATAKRAKFILKRSGSTSGALNVKLKLRDHKLDTGANDLRLVKPGAAPTPLMAAYGSTQDYYLSPGWPTGPLALPHDQTVAIPAGQSEVVFTVIPKADNLTENNVIVLQVLPDPNASAPAYTVGLQDRAEVLLWDGPEFTLYELTDSRWTPTYWQPAQGSTATGLNHLTFPLISGWASYSASPAATVGGYWAGYVTGSITDVWNAEAGYPSPLPYGIANSGLLVGTVTYLSPTRAFRRLGTTEVWLGPASGGNSGAYGVNPAATLSTHYIAGYSPVNTHQRPVVWVNGQTTTPTDLLATLDPAAAAAFTGEARAANDAGVVVGQAKLAAMGPVQPFRSKTLVTALAAGDALPSPPGAFDQSGIANAVSAEGIAVGRFRLNEMLNPKVAAYWAARSGTSENPPGVSLGRWETADGVLDNLSEALGIAQVSGTDWIVGWSGDSETSPPSNPDIRAVIMKGVSNPVWRDLNDKHFTHGGPGWSLKKAHAVNTQGWIVGNGLLYGAPRGFLLVPRSAGQ